MGAGHCDSRDSGEWCHSCQASIAYEENAAADIGALAVLPGAVVMDADDQAIITVEDNRI
jgi:hypothetical protein